MKGRERFIFLFMLAMLGTAFACQGFSIHTDVKVNVDPSPIPTIQRIVITSIPVINTRPVSAIITNAHMARDEQNTDGTAIFLPGDETFYCFFDLSNAPSDTKVKGVWTAVNAQGVAPNFLIDTIEITHGDGSIYFTLKRSADAWPVGKYKIDLYINDKLVQTVNFEVR